MAAQRVTQAMVEVLAVDPLSLTNIRVTQAMVEVLVSVASSAGGSRKSSGRWFFKDMCDEGESCDKELLVDT